MHFPNKKPKSWLVVLLFLLIYPLTAFSENHSQLLFPLMDGARIQNPRPTILIRFHEIEGSDRWASLRLLVDDIDVSQLSELTDKGLTYTPQADMGFGKHSVTLQSMDNTGKIFPDRLWTFVIPQSDIFDTASAQILTDLQMDRRVTAKKHTPDPEWKLHSNATFSSAIETGDLRLSLVANAWYTEQQGYQDGETPDDHFNLNNFLLEISYLNQRMALGDLSLNATELISNSISRRGGLLELVYDQTKARLFMLSSVQTTGFENTLGLDNPDQRLFGGSIEQCWSRFNDLTVKGTAISGKNHQPEDYNSGTLVTGNDGQIYSVQISAKPFSNRISMTGEVGISRFDADTTDDSGHERAKAVLFRFSGLSNTFSYGGGLKRLDQNFHSIMDATGVDNRSEYTLYGTKTFSTQSLTASCAYIIDNMEKDPLLPMIHNTSFDLAYNLYKSNWPSIFFNSNLTFQKSTDEPANNEEIENRSHTLTGGFSLVKENWNLTPSYTYTKMTDDGSAGNDSNTHQTTLTLGLQPTERLSLSPSLSWSQTDSGSQAPTTQTYQGTLSGSYYVNPRHDLFVTLSAMDSDTDDDSAHTTTTDYICQYNWHPDPPFLKQARKSISLRGRYNRTEDKITDDAAEDYAVSLVINIGGLPINFNK